MIAKATKPAKARCNCGGPHLGWLHLPGCPVLAERGEIPTSSPILTGSLVVDARALIPTLTGPMRRALLRKIWIPKSGGGQVLLAERMAKLGMFERDEGEYRRTKLGHAVLVLLDVPTTLADDEARREWLDSRPAERRAMMNDSVSTAGRNTWIRLARRGLVDHVGGWTLLGERVILYAQLTGARA